MCMHGPHSIGIAGEAVLKRASRLHPSSCSLTFTNVIPMQGTVPMKVRHLSTRPAAKIHQCDIVIPMQDSMSMELHAKTTIRDSCFFFRIKRRGCSSTNSACSTSSGPQQASAMGDDKFLYG